MLHTRNPRKVFLLEERVSVECVLIRSTSGNPFSLKSLCDQVSVEPFKRCRIRPENDQVPGASVRSRVHFLRPYARHRADPLKKPRNSLRAELSLLFKALYLLVQYRTLEFAQSIIPAGGEVFVGSSTQPPPNHMQAVARFVQIFAVSCNQAAFTASEVLSSLKAERSCRSQSAHAPALPLRPVSLTCIFNQSDTV